ncbi:MAG: ATP-binding protein, partial [Planctomycetes bacterium]|nr:ATP-binding protein [Planctomycetota bacterium]
RKRLEAERTLLQEDLERRVAERTAALALANAELIGQGRSLRIFKNVIEQNPVAILITDQDMGITYSNPAFTALSGYSAGEALGREPGYFSAHAGGTLSGQRRTVAEGRTWSGELACRRKDGGEYWVEALVAPMTGTGGVTTGYLCFHRDITAIKQAQAEARQRADELIQSDKMAALGTLVAGVGHEINNPANFISLNAPMLRDFWSAAEPALDAAAAQDPELRLCNLPWARVRVLVPRLFTGIEEGIDRIRRIVGDLRDFARPDTSGSQRVDLNRVVKAGTAITSHAIGKATAAFTCRLDPDLPAVAGSFQKLEQVVVNLVLNACQALPDPARAVDVSTAYDPVLHRVVLTVEDQGVGIPADHLAHLGEPFFTTKRDRGGTGLGLSVTRRIVEDHGGEIHFQSHAGRGTRVTVLLPAVAPAKP